jgi:integrase
MKAIYSFTSRIGAIIVSYIDLKRVLGRKFEVEHDILKYLDCFLATSQTDLTAESFAEWCKTIQHIASSSRRSWMRIVRNLCLYRRRFEPLCFIPNPSQFPRHNQSIQPHIFTEEEIIRLLDAIKKLKPGTRSILREENFRLALVLFYTSGLRRSELIRLTISDYNSLEHTLLIRESKFHKSRLIPLSNDGWNELEDYLSIRRKLRLPISTDSPLLWNAYKENGFYTGWGIAFTFRTLFKMANIRTISGAFPQLHSFRHTFAVHALLRWYRNGDDVQTKLPFLSIYMGHVSIVSTEYYLRYVEPLASSASNLFEKHYGGIFPKSDKGGMS